MLNARSSSSSVVRPGDGSALDTDVLRVRADAGASLDDAGRLPPRARRAVAVAVEVGAPISEALDGALAAEDDARRARRAITVASAQTRVVAGGLLIAPLLLVPGLGRLVGADLAGFYSSSLGVAVLVVGLGLLALGAAMVVVLVRRVGRVRTARGADRRRGIGVVAAAAAGFVVWSSLSPALVPAAVLLTHRAFVRARGDTPPVEVDEAADLAATALAGGVSVAEALRVAAQQLPAHAPWLHRLAFDLEVGSSMDPVAAPASTRPGATRAVDGHVDPTTRVAAVLRAAAELGAPAAPTLRKLASDLRADDLARILAAAERLPAQLTFPTTLCLLPATVLLIGAPIIHAGLTAAGT